MKVLNKIIEFILGALGILFVALPFVVIYLGEVVKVNISVGRVLAIIFLISVVLFCFSNNSKKE